MSEDTITPFKSGYIAIVGWPNVGKSTLLNSLLDSKLSIVSPKPQTTRQSILGILNLPQAQAIFVDTPGWLQPTDSLQKQMKSAIMRSIHDEADIILWLLDPVELTNKEQEFGDKLIQIGKPIIAAINKSDLPLATELKSRIKMQLAEILKDHPSVFISAKTKMALSDLKTQLVNKLPIGPAYFPTGQITDRWERFYVAELIREKLFHMYRDEVPHASAIQVTDFTEKPGRKDHIVVSITVERDSQKVLVIGSGGRAIKELGQSSRMEIEKHLGRPVYLELKVQVHKNWRKDDAFLKKLDQNFNGNSYF